MKTIWIAATLAALAPSARAIAQPGTTQPAAEKDVLTLERAIELAMQQQPSLRRTRAQIEASNAQVDIARVIRKPTVTLGTSANVGSRPQRPCSDDPTQICAGFFDPNASFSLSVQANWRIFDFGLTRANIRAAELSALANSTALATNVLDIRRDVETAYLEAVARGRLVKVAEETVKAEEIRLDQARRFVDAQAKDPIEVAQAQARAANARSSLAQARSLEAIALANLRAAIGWLDATRSPVVESTWPAPPPVPPDLVTLVATSRKQRPELVQLDRQIDAAEASATAAGYRNRPVLAASAQSNWNPDSLNYTQEPTWSAGISLSWQVFDGGRASAEQRFARANVTAARADRDSLLVTLTSQLESARAQIVANAAAVTASEEAVVAARAQVQLADARYAQGLGSQIELADAQFAVTTAAGNLVQTQWQLADAWAQLRRALGNS
ncbi:MAG: TolC family protein [Deltaproteobacteria bacterium]|nr:TolC family protein [Deltaproteobacteria bacterium]